MASKKCAVLIARKKIRSSQFSKILCCIPPKTEANQATANAARKSVSAGHGRNGAAAYRNANKVQITHARLVSGDRCPDCERGKVYPQRDPGLLVRIKGQPRLTRPCVDSKGSAAICVAEFSRRMRQRTSVIRSTMRRQQA